MTIRTIVGRMSSGSFAFTCMFGGLLGSFVFFFTAFILSAIIWGSSGNDTLIGVLAMFIFISTIAGFATIILVLRGVRKKTRIVGSDLSVGSVQIEAPLALLPISKEEALPGATYATLTSGSDQMPNRPAERSQKIGSGFSKWFIPACTVAVLGLAIAKRDHVPLNLPFDPLSNLGVLDKLFFYTGQVVCEVIATIGWGSFFFNYCTVGIVTFRLPNYIQVGQVTLVLLLIIVVGGVLGGKK